MRYLILGAAGQLGSDLHRMLPEARALGRDQLSITDQAAVAQAVRGVDVVLNCAAYNAVDAAEADPGPAFAVNAEGPANLATACRAAGARLVHFSTNYVFDGLGERPFTELDEPGPLGAYARSKLEGERRALEALPATLVVRSSGLYGLQGSAVKGGSFPERVVRRALEGQPLRMVADQRLNPTYTPDLAAGVLRLVAERAEGVIHLVSEGCCSWLELAREALRLAGLSVDVEPISTAELAVPAPRPLNGCLTSVRVAPLRGWREGLADWWSQRPVMMPRP